MEKLGCRFPIAMAYVPWQKWGELYDNEYGLKQGTIFKDLNKVFCGVRH
ncbi:MAG: spore coat associated protein CotJA [Eubacteriales bacterium]|nr:spore coat associated protein CotJA [Eubacteriales bacterium]